MDAPRSDGLTRRRTLGLLAVGTLAGCLGGSDDDSDAGSADDAGGGTNAPGDTGTDGGATGTSPAGSCGSAFGDTDQSYDPVDSGWIVTFDYPTGGEIFFEDDTSNGSAVSVGYVETELEDNFEQKLSVSQRGPATDTDPDIGGTLIAEHDRYEDGGTVTFDGSERRVAVVRTDDSSVIWTMGVLGPENETYRMEVQASVGLGDPCGETYEAVCERVLTSFRRR